MRTKPNRLTQREFYILANACVPGSDEFYEVYETAARMYPDDPVANINAANAALSRKDYVTAEKYLSRADNSKEAQYARGALLFSKGDLEGAEEILKGISNMSAATEILNQIEGMRQKENEKISGITLE